MYVKIWDINTSRYIDIPHVKHIYQSVDKTYFKLDEIEYKTSRYDLQFVAQED